MKLDHLLLLSDVKEELGAVMLLAYWFPGRFVIATNYEVRPCEIARWLTLTARIVRRAPWRKPTP